VGAIWFRGREFITALSETLGYKTGLALGEERLRALVEEVDEDLWPPDDTAVLRIRSEVFEDLFVRVLSQLGAGPPRPIISPLMEVYRRYEHDSGRARVAEDLMSRYTTFLQTAVEVTPPGTAIDPSPFMREAAEQGPVALEIAVQLLETTNTYLFQSPFNRLRRIEWADLRELDELFQSEQLKSPHGEYFDQRFVDFLTVNFDDIDEVNWRQFEGLAAEFFGRLGYGVALGPGRGDDGVDIRLWPDATLSDDEPATVLVQCKRERRKVTKATVKALWADVVAADARSGLIVTSSAFSPGARETRDARGYPIAEADRETLRAWVLAMRSPGTGVFLGE
jgi:restriction system protein